MCCLGAEDSIFEIFDGIRYPAPGMEPYAIILLYERIVLIIHLIMVLIDNTKYELISQREPCLGGVRSDLSSTVLHDRQHDTTGE